MAGRDGPSGDGLRRAAGRCVRAGGRGRRRFVFYPLFLMKALCFALFACAFNLLIGYVGLLSFGHAAFFGTAAYITAYAVKVWGFGRSPAFSPAPRSRRVLGAVFGWLAIRRQGIYFAMITLALAQMVYFVALAGANSPAARTASRRCRAARCSALIDLDRPLAMYYFVLAVFLRRLRRHLPHDPFAVRPGAEGDPRERAARDLARLPTPSATSCSPSCCRRRSPGLAGATKALVFQLASLTDVHWHDVGRRGADDAARRHGHHFGAGGRRVHLGDDGKLSRGARLLGDGDPGRDLRRLRPDLPPRHRRRDRLSSRALARPHRARPRRRAATTARGPAVYAPGLARNIRIGV